MQNHSCLHLRNFSPIFALVIDYFSIAEIITPLFYTLLHILRNLTIEAEHLSCRGFLYTQGFGMKRLAREELEAVLYKLFVLSLGSSLEYLIPSIAFVIEKWMSYMSKVCPNLVSTTCF